MMGEKTLSETKNEIRAAFAKKGTDVETWLDQQMAKLNRGPHPDRAALETMRSLRNALQRPGRAQSVDKRKTKKSNGKKKPAA